MARPRKNTNENKTAVKLKDEEYVTIRNNIFGTLTIPLRSSGMDSSGFYQTLTLQTYGDEDRIMYSDFKHIKNNHKRMIEQGWLQVVEEGRVNEETLQIKNLVKDLIKDEDVDAFLELRDMDEMDKYINSLSKKNLLILVDAIKDRIVNDEFDSGSVIRFLEQKLEISLDKAELIEAQAGL